MKLRYTGVEKSAYAQERVKKNCSSFFFLEGSSARGNEISLSNTTESATPGEWEGEGISTAAQKQPNSFTVAAIMNTSRVRANYKY